MWPPSISGGGVAFHIQSKLCYMYKTRQEEWPGLWPPMLSGEQELFHVPSRGVKNKKGRAEKLSFDNLHHAFAVQACFDCGKQKSKLTSRV